jgi:diaminopropionate ammonia-lyase
MRGLLNPQALRDARFRGLFRDDEYRDVHAYFGTHPELPPTPLRALPALARSLGLAAVSVKDETGRFGLNAFKIVGVRYAVHRLGDAAVMRGLVCATAGNHGRAVARVASDKGVPCTVFVPALRPGDSAAEIATRSSRISAMESDGAQVIVVHGAYEHAVREAAAYGAATGATIVSDVSWPGYEEIPRFIMAGYTQIFEEAYGQWDRMPGVVVVQGGVGGLVCAAASWCAWRYGLERPFIVACEPDGAACLMASAEAGHPVVLDGELPTSMAGLRCAEPSPAAWPAIAGGVDAFVSIPDALAVKTIQQLEHAPGGPIASDPPIRAGLSGVCSAAALVALATSPALAGVRRAAGMDRSTHALVVATEGP